MTIPGIVVGEAANQYNTINHVNNNEEASETVLRRPSINLENRTQAIKTVLDAIVPAVNGNYSRFEIVIKDDNADFIAETDKIYILKPTAAALVVTLPNPVVNGTRITFKEITGDTGVHVITIKRHGAEKIDDNAADYVLKNNYETVTFVSNGTNWYTVDISGHGTSLFSGIPVTYFDNASLTLPTSTPFTIDNNTLIDGDMVLFNKLSDGTKNNKIYKATISGASIVWKIQSQFGGTSPSNGHSVRILKGRSFALQIAIFDGTTWKINDTIRMFNGNNYWEASSLQTVTINENQTTPEKVFEVTAAGSENIFINYAIKRGTNKDSGTLIITHNGTTAQLARVGASIAEVGVTFSVSIAAGKIKLSYVSTDMTPDTAGTMNYFMSRWSDTPGGVAGVPDYSNAASPAGVAAAAGSVGNVQYNVAGSALGAEATFNWDTTKKELTLDGLTIGALKSYTLNDNTLAPVAVITFPVASYKNVVLEYSALRGAAARTGRIMITTNGTDVGFKDDHITTAALGLVLSAVINGTNLELRYTLTSAGSNATLKCSLRKWL